MRNLDYIFIGVIMAIGIFLIVFIYTTFYLIKEYAKFFDLINETKDKLNKLYTSHEELENTVNDHYRQLSDEITLILTKHNSLAGLVRKTIKDKKKKKTKKVGGDNAAQNNT